ncbi:MAG TPA: PDZ domain-containing protein [Methylomusa anaerophila]|uniref:PDZ domain-containing protein n=1 Tax=Methylomusa anaerophila TaxID=1930071 RepID=UPI001E301695|nr:PDZ domain-containing protein [Methylomusa anaerophila]HML88523.1 PDZ domain-containing protein [Methylomusa anaerophila]
MITGITAFPWPNILLLIIDRALSVLQQPIFWVILALVGWQYRQMRQSQQKMFGVYSYSLVRQVLLAGFYGLLGGIVGSFLLTVAGVTLNKLGLNYIWPVALALMLINMRFLCFAYAGGLVALANILFGWPDVNVPQVLGLVAVLHITESVLIAVSGGYSAVPLIVKRQDGRIVGAFSLQNFWPLPLALLAVISIPADSASEGLLYMPEWWPLIPLGVEPPAGESLIYAMLPVVAALGYTDIAVSSLPGERRRRSALHLALYSVLLLILAILSAQYSWLKVLAALLSPLGHEALIQLDNRRELTQRPYFIPPDHGVKILNAIPDTPAGKILKPGDILLSLDGITINSRYDLAAAISYAPAEFTVEFERKGLRHSRQVKFKNGERKLGVILVPDGDESYYVEMKSERFGLLDWIKRKLPKR